MSEVLEEKLITAGAERPFRSDKVRIEETGRRVRAYFAGRPDDLLVLDVVGGEGWEKLCPFLGLEPPAEAFPHFNAG